MTAVTIDPTDSRSLKSLLIAAEAGQWIKARRQDGRKAYGIPSQSQPGLYHLTTCTSCTCFDSRRGNDCKHQRAVRLHVVLTKALEPQPKSQADEDVFAKFDRD